MTSDDDPKTTSSEIQGGSLSRRQILTAGLAVASAGLTTVPEAAAADAPQGLVGVAPSGSTAVEFRARLAQTGSSGERFVGYGYITRAHGAGLDSLFAPGPQNETTSLLTAYATGDLTRRVLDQSVHSLDIEGTLTVYQRPVPGASFSDSSSFQFGSPVATFDLVLQDVLTVFAPGRGIPTLNGDMRQTAAGKLTGISGATFGHVGAGARLLATGIGTLVDPVTLNANLEMAGNWTTK
jgi:hypothetical protein